jgi:hypothetical protein
LLIWDRHRLGKLGEYDDFDTVDLVGWWILMNMVLKCSEYPEWD